MMHIGQVNLDHGRWQSWGSVASLGVSTVISYNSPNTDPRASKTIDMHPYSVILPGYVVRDEMAFDPPTPELMCNPLTPK